MSDNYTGLHGRSTFEKAERHRHFVPEAWEDLNRGICPQCGRTVRWEERLTAWVVDPSLTVLVLTDEEVRHVRIGLVLSALEADRASRRRSSSDAERAMAGRRRGFVNALDITIDRQYDLNRPFEEEPGE